jgi:hypothetical protein
MAKDPRLDNPDDPFWHDPELQKLWWKVMSGGKEWDPNRKPSFRRLQLEPGPGVSSRDIQSKDVPDGDPKKE